MPRKQCVAVELSVYIAVVYRFEEEDGNKNAIFVCLLVVYLVQIFGLLIMPWAKKHHVASRRIVLRPRGNYFIPAAVPRTRGPAGVAMVRSPAPTLTSSRRRESHWRPGQHGPPFTRSSRRVGGVQDEPGLVEGRAEEALQQSTTTGELSRTEAGGNLQQRRAAIATGGARENRRSTASTLPRSSRNRPRWQGDASLSRQTPPVGTSPRSSPATSSTTW